MIKQRNKAANKCIDLIKEYKWIILVCIALFLERVCAAYFLGFSYNINSDDLSYVKSGIEFANTGRITMHGVLSAQIMPGMPVLIGFFSLFWGGRRGTLDCVKNCLGVDGSNNSFLYL